jgi:glutamine synthetase adenylyltransferase
MSNHQFFKRLASASSRKSPANLSGFLRIDLRLRPEGDAGPLARSLPTENYYASGAILSA